MSDMECETLLLEGKDSEGSDYDEEALLADVEEADCPSKATRVRTRTKIESSELEPEDVLDLGTQDVELEEDANKKYSVMTVSSTTLNESDINASSEKDKEERETRFKQERKTNISKKYTNIPDLLDDVCVPNFRPNQRPFRGARGRGYRGNNTNNQQRNKPGGNTVLVNPHFKGKVTVTNNSRLNWDARQLINHSKQHSTGYQQQFQQQNPPPNFNYNPPNWYNPQNMQVPQQFMQNVPQMNQVPFNHPQVPQQQFAPPVYHQSPQQCFIQPLPEQQQQQQFFFTPPPFNNPPPPIQYQQPQQFIPQPFNYPPQPNQNPPPIMMNNQFVSPVFNPANNQQLNFNKRPANVVMRKIKKRSQIVSTNLHEVRTVQTPDTTVKDDEDDATKEYRKLIENQKKKREEILKIKEERRRQAAAQNESVLQQTNAAANKTIQKAAEPAKDNLSSFLANRKIIAKDETLLDTNFVLISNLAVATTEVKLRKMCVGIGGVKTLQMSPKERQATIQFNSVASAHTFFKKYQRTMLDLSVINVVLKL